MQLEQVNVVKSDDNESDENEECFYFCFFYIYSGLAWLSNICNSLKSFISAYRALINKRALICDHRKYLSKIWTNVCLLLKNICLLLSDFDRGQFQNLKFSF
jgi:hypothetical protein